MITIIGIARTAHATLALPLSYAIGAIELYPAGTLQMAFAPMCVPSYKGRDGGNGRNAILNTIKQEMILPPTDWPQAAKEGWIWTRRERETTHE